MDRRAPNSARNATVMACADAWRDGRTRSGAHVYTHVCGQLPEWNPMFMNSSLRRKLSAGIANMGDPTRLLKVLRRVNDGQGVTLAALGASVTAEYGGAIGEMQDTFKRREGIIFHGELSGCHAGCVKQGWLLPVLDYLIGLNHSARLLLANAGVAGNMFPVYSTCFDMQVPKADLYIVDTASIARVNMAGVETVLRLLLEQPGSPAVVMLNFFDWCSGARSRTHTSYQHCFGTNRTRVLRDSWTAHQELHSSLLELAYYYSLPSLSIRNAFYDPAMRGEIDPAALVGDGIHPRGRYYVRLIGALVSHFLHLSWRTAVHSMVEEQPLSLPCEPLHRHAGKAALHEACFNWVPNLAAARPDLLEGSHGWEISHLQPPQRPRTSVRPPAEWLANFKNNSWRYVPCLETAQAGAVARIQLVAHPEVETSAATRTNGSWPATFWFTFLSSYDSMGRADFSCGHACECAPMRIDAHRGESEPQQYVSVWLDHALAVRLWGACVVTVRMDARSSSGGHRFKLGKMAIRWDAQTSTREGKNSSCAASRGTT